MADRAALVTGASRGIGAAIARRLAADGFAVALGCRDREAADAVAAGIEAAGGRATIVAGDLADPDVPARLVEDTVAAFDRLDVLINNAGGATPARLPDITAGSFDREVAVNLRAPLLLMKAALPRLEEAGGCIVNVSSLNGSRMPSRGAPVYSATKAGLDVLTRSLAADLGPLGIRVNAVAPGATATGTFISAASADIQDVFKGRTALGRLGEPDEVAAVVGFLVSDDARWITGQIISASGGLE